MADSSSFSSLFALVDNHLSKTNLQQESQPSTSGLGSFKLPGLNLHQDCQPSTSGLGSFRPPRLNPQQDCQPSTSGLGSFRPPRLNFQQDCQPSTSGLGSFRLPGLNIQRGVSDTGLPSSSSMRFPLPNLSLSEGPINNDISKQLGKMSISPPSEQVAEETSAKLNISMSDCPINDVLAIQLSNMFKAREAKEEQKRREELKKVEESLLNQEASSCLIDLMPAIQIPGQMQPQQVDTASTSSSMESLAIPDASDSMEDDQQDKNVDLELLPRPVSPKPITTDLSYMMKHKLGKCSEFGKVLCARYRPVAAPYFREYVPTSHIKVFDFSTPSPDDIALDRLRRPSYYSNSRNTLTVFD